MVVKAPKNEYEKDVLCIIRNARVYYSLSEGEKAIIYDLATQDVPKYIHFNWEDIDLENYVYNIKLSYDKYRNQTSIDVVCACINRCFPNYIATLEGPMYDKKLIIREVKKCK